MRRLVVMAVISSTIFIGSDRSSLAVQVPKLVEETRLSDIHDAAKLFGHDAVAAARAELRSFESKTGVASMIATVETTVGRFDRK